MYVDRDPWQAWAKLRTHFPEKEDLPVVPPCGVNEDMFRRKCELQCVPSVVYSHRDMPSCMRSQPGELISQKIAERVSLTILPGLGY